MSREDAIDLLRCVEQFGTVFNQATEITLRMRDLAEAKQVRQILGEMVARSFDLTVLVAGQYPDLKPND